MRLGFLILFCGLAGFGGTSPAFAQASAPAPSAAAASSKLSDLQKTPESQPVKPGKKDNPDYQAAGGLSSSAQDYQKDNPMLKTDLTRVSDFQGKMFETKEFQVKQFSGGKDQPIVLNKMFVKSSDMTGNKNAWQDKNGEQPKKSDWGEQKSNFIDRNKKAGIGGADVPLKVANGFDAKAEEAQKAKGFTALLADGQKRYLGPESPNSPSEMELIQDHLKKVGTPEELKKNQLTTDEVKKLLQPEVPLTRPK